MSKEAEFIIRNSVSSSNSGRVRHLRTSLWRKAHMKLIYWSLKNCRYPCDISSPIQNMKISKTFTKPQNWRWNLWNNNRQSVWVSPSLLVIPALIYRKMGQIFESTNVFCSLV
ncbi:hypothetical protein AVEN_37109-1 [Araneus ventricosus]|uniref:Uncharacterized protein n=1 Tax=Araneus ventricosus TaxID=182803 RepID=A0A4Y2TIS4_ARAVE|nr:hypothetical protein AVEN_37109-1 [Araneus ventricosus]